MTEIKLSLAEWLELAPGVSLVVDRAGLITQAGNDSLEMFGYESAELVGQPVEMLLPQKLRATHIGHRQKYSGSPVKRRMSERLNLHCRHKNGSEFPVDISLAPLTDGQVVAMIQDRSQQRVTLIEKRLGQLWIVWYAAALTFWRGALLLYDSNAGATTSTGAMMKLAGNHYLAGLVFIVVALLAAYFMQSRKYAWLLLPLLIALIISSIEAIEAIGKSQFSDGVIRPWAFIAADQIPSVFIVVFYAAAIFEAYYPLSWIGLGPREKS